MIALHARGYPVDHPVQQLAPRRPRQLHDRRRGRPAARGMPVAGLGHGARRDRAARRRPRRRPSRARARGATGWLGREVQTRGDWAVRKPELADRRLPVRVRERQLPRRRRHRRRRARAAAAGGPVPRRVRPRHRLDARHAVQRRRLGRVRRRQHEQARRASCRSATSARSPTRRAPMSRRTCSRRWRTKGATDETAAQRGLEWLLREQEPTAPGSAAGARTTSTAPAPSSPRSPPAACRGHPSVARAVDWLARCRIRAAASARTSARTATPSWRGRGASTASQTAWALIGLHARARRTGRRPSARSAISSTPSCRDGGWDEPYYTGTGFPGDFYLNYHLYRDVFPVMALGGCCG